MDGWMDGRTDGWMDGWMDGEIEGERERDSLLSSFAPTQHKNPQRCARAWGCRKSQTP